MYSHQPHHLKTIHSATSFENKTQNLHIPILLYLVSLLFRCRPFRHFVLEAIQNQLGERQSFEIDPHVFTSTTPLKTIHSATSFENIFWEHFWGL